MEASETAIFAGAPTPLSSGSSFTGLRSVLMSHRPCSLPFGTILRPKDGGPERVMVVHGNDVFPVADAPGYHAYGGGVQTMISNWDDYWEPDT